MIFLSFPRSVEVAAAHYAAHDGTQGPGVSQQRGVRVGQ